jgi:hypothetical protein
LGLTTISTARPVDQRAWCQRKLDELHWRNTR